MVSVQRVFGYFNTQVKAQSDQLLKYRAKRYIQASTELSKDMIEIMNSVRCMVTISKTPSSRS